MSDLVRVPPEAGRGPTVLTAPPEDGGETVVLAGLCLIIGGAIALLLIQILSLIQFV
ncbi:MAG: hypothetical protein PGN34_03125 [Methylobacterium frigidaeris]